MHHNLTKDTKPSHAGTVCLRFFMEAFVKSLSNKREENVIKKEKYSMHHTKITKA